MDADADATDQEGDAAAGADAAVGPRTPDRPRAGADGPVAVGPPAKMAENLEELTPMMTQYHDLCAEYDDALVLFQVGDFYETFCEAAEVTSRLLEITLTQREDSSGTYPMSGIPVDNAASYVETLLEAGYRVAIADQVEDPEEVTGPVRRAVTRVVTPGTVVDDELLSAGTTNYVACVARGDGTEVADDADADGDGDDDEGEYGVAFVDVSTGEFLATGAGRAGVADELDRFDPAEVLVGPAVPPDAFEFDCMVTPYDPAAFDRDTAHETLAEHVTWEVLESPAEVRACGALLAYAEYTQGGADGDLGYVTRLRRYDPREYLRLDATAVRSLELFDNRAGDSATLLDVLDGTACALGRRLLTDWLRRPLVDRATVEARHDAVGEWTDLALAREVVRARLTDVYDVERLVTRVSRGRANARDLRSLKETLDAVPDVREAMSDVESDRLRTLRERLDDLADVRDLIDRAIRPEPPVEITEGGVVRRGFDEELDDLRATEQEGREWVADLEEGERERTGIDSLSVGFNQVHGYYIEVTNPNLDRVPEDYTRRQTLKNSERFYTPELKRREDEILGAADRADAREHELFRGVRDDVASEADRIQEVADALAELDVLSTLGAVAVERDYVRPELGTETIDIEAGRHPVVETVEPQYVPNDAHLERGECAVITGPNMSGKSTYMRGVALTCVLAQMGSFVPADAARLPVLDRVFTRVGASDDIAGGESTFMREMTELTEILHGAGEDSLVLLDEVGRGTSTADGLAIARAVTEYVHDELGATTLFATHYHDLTGVADDLESVFNLHFEATRSDGEVTFLHEVQAGASSSSYGVEVARMAGVPDPVVERSRELVDDPGPAVQDADGLGDGEVVDRDVGPGDAGGGGGGETRIRLEDQAEDDTAPTGAGDRGWLAREIRGLNLADTTPLEALDRLNRIQRRLDDADHTDHHQAER